MKNNRLPSRLIPVKAIPATVPGARAQRTSEVDSNELNTPLAFELQVAGFNYLVSNNTNIPQTEEGMNGLKDAYIQVLRRYLVSAATLRDRRKAARGD